MEPFDIDTYKMTVRIFFGGVGELRCFSPRPVTSASVFHEACDGCTSSTRRCVWGPCARTRSCSEVSSQLSCLCVAVWKHVIWTPLCLFIADLCRDQFSRCGVAALSGGCTSLGASCGKSCGGCWLSRTSGTWPAQILPLFSHVLLVLLLFLPNVPFNVQVITHVLRALLHLKFFLLCLSFYTCVWINVLQRTLMIV